MFLRRSHVALASLLMLVVLGGVAAAQEQQDVERAIEALAAIEDAAFLQDPEDILAWVDVPKRAAKGETIRLTITIENGRDDRPFRLSVINIADDYLDGFKVASIDPEPRHRDHSLGSLTLETPVDVAPDEVYEMTIELKCRKKGVFIGDVDVAEGDQFLTRAAQTRIGAAR